MVVGPFADTDGTLDGCLCPASGCGPYSTWNDCGTACEPTCMAQPLFCTYQCVPQCVCNEGYVWTQASNVYC